MACDDANFKNILFLVRAHILAFCFETNKNIMRTRKNGRKMTKEQLTEVVKMACDADHMNSGELDRSLTDKQEEEAWFLSGAKVSDNEHLDCAEGKDMSDVSHATAEEKDDVHNVVNKEEQEQREKKRKMASEGANAQEKMAHLSEHFLKHCLTHACSKQKRCI